MNKRYRLLEIEIDGVFKCMLLLKKKKYAAIKLDPQPDGSLVEARDCCSLNSWQRDTLGHDLWAK